MSAAETADYSDELNTGICFQRQRPLVDYSCSESESDYVPPSVADEDDFVYHLIPRIETFKETTVYDYSDDYSDIIAMEGDDEVADCTEPHVTVYSKFAHGKGQKNRKLPCYFCDKFAYKMSRHLQRQHSSEQQVAAALVSGSGRRLRLKQLYKMGTFKHK